MLANGTDIPTTLYYKIEQEIKKWIAEGRYKTGELIPSEAELQKIFNASRLTIRDAIKHLAAQGFLEKKQGVGTYIRRPIIDHRRGFLYSPSEEILARNFTLVTEVIQLEWFEADEDTARKLNLELDEGVVFLERLRYADRIPAQLIKSYLPAKYVPGIDKVDFRKNFLYRTLEERYQLRLKEADETIEAAKISKRDAGLLDIAPGTPVLLTRRSTYLVDGTIIEHNNIIYRPNILNYHIKLKGRDQSKLIYSSFTEMGVKRDDPTTNLVRKGGEVDMS